MPSSVFDFGAIRARLYQLGRRDALLPPIGPARVLVDDDVEANVACEQIERGRRHENGRLVDQARKARTAMHVGRRGFLALTAVATAALSFWKALAAPVMRHVEPSPSKPQRERNVGITGVKSVHFDGSTYLQNNRLPTMPSSGSKFLLSFWYKGLFPGNYRPQNILLTQPDEYTIVLAYYITPSMGGTAVLTIVSTDMTKRSRVFKKSINVPYDDDWHHILVYLDTQAASCRAYVDDSAATVNNSYTAGSGFNVDCAGRWCVSYRPETTPAPYTGDLAELFFLVGADVDITDPAVRAKFIDPDKLLPLYLDAGGLYPFFDQGIAPQIFLSGNHYMFPRNYPGWSATLVQQFDSDPTSQFTVIGNLTSPEAGPFSPPIGSAGPRRRRAQP